MKIYVMKPSSAFVDVEEGQVIRLGGKKLMLIDRDPWVASFVRVYWFDPYLTAAAHWVRSVRERHGRSNIESNKHEPERPAGEREGQPQ